MISLLFALTPIVGNAGPTDTVGQPADIVQSAYQFRADRRPDANAPESWIAVMLAAGMPVNAKVDLNNLQLKRTLYALLWEEIRPVQTLQLRWSAGARHKPKPSDLKITALMNQGASSSWWNNLKPVAQTIFPTVSPDGATYTYELGLPTCGLVVSVTGNEEATRFDVPQARVIVPESWKKMDLEVEWGFDPSTKGKDFSGRVDAYDGRIAGVSPLKEDRQTLTTGGVEWHSADPTSDRRGVKLSLLYIGTSRWRKQQPFTTQPDDVARTIVTVRTKSGSFSFLASDLEKGPILAPEFGFFVRQTRNLTPQTSPKSAQFVVPVPMTAKLESIAGASDLTGWGSNDTPWFGSNASNHAIDPLGIKLPAHSVAMHPGQFVDAVAEWTSPIEGRISLKGNLTHAQAGSHGIEWWVTLQTDGSRTVLDHGVTNGVGSYSLKEAANLQVRKGDKVLLVIGPNGDYRGDTTILDYSIVEAGGQGRVWNLEHDVSANVTAANPHHDSYGNSGVWTFASEMPMVGALADPSDPPIIQASAATTAKEFEAELAARHEQTIRERIRQHPEQTWEQAVTATRGAHLPAIPAPPEGKEPVMQVEVPDRRLTAQWKLGTWHMLRHCATNPQTGKLWFNDYPYGILAAESYLVLTVLDLMGSHQEAQDGFDQWTMLPFTREHPVGLFTDGAGALTYADGPPGVGGNMDGIHCTGAGSIGWALAQHYLMTGDKAWLKANEKRIVANAEWMLRQRLLNRNNFPGGDRLWCNGLQPAMQVTPDSGGLWMQFYECEGDYWAFVSRLADTISNVDPAGGAKLKRETEAYRKDLRAAVDRSITLSPVMPVRDGTYHSVIPFACYVRGPATGAWGWMRNGSGTHVGQLYWDTVQNAATLISPAGLLDAKDPRVQGYLDVLEDRFLLENIYTGDRDWFEKGWQYQAGLERTSNMHLAADDIPVFLRSFLNGYAVDILPNDGYTFNEHAVHGPPDKIFEEAAFLERFRNLLVMEDGQDLWLARGTPKAWLEQGQTIRVARAPTMFGDVAYSIDSDVDHGQIRATVTVPERGRANQILLRLRHPQSRPIRGVTVNGKPWRDFDPAREVVKLHGTRGSVTVLVKY
jgi:hypothetical protein